MGFVKYGNERIELDYSQSSKILSTLKGIKVTAKTEKEIPNLEGDYEHVYQTAEEETMLYFIKNAMDKATQVFNGCFRLVKIARIKQTVDLIPANGHFRLEMVLGGVALYCPKIIDR